MTRRTLAFIGGMFLTAAFAAPALAASATKAALGAEAGQQPPAAAPQGKPATPPPAQGAAPQAVPVPGKVPPTAEKPAVPQAPEPQGYTYNPEGRRDPFISLARGGSPQAADPKGPRPPGLPGLPVGEVTLSGVMHSRTGYVGLLKGADGKTYIVRAGDKLLDGTIRTITANAMVIVQQVNDPLSFEKQREVRKVLRQTDEVK